MKKLFGQAEKTFILSISDSFIALIKGKMTDREEDGLIISREIMEEIFKEVQDELLAMPIQNVSRE